MRLFALFTLLLTAGLGPFSCRDVRAQHCRPRIYAPTAYRAPTYSAPYVAPARVVNEVKVVKVVEQPYNYYELSLSAQLDLVADAVAYRILRDRILLGGAGGAPAMPRLSESRLPDPTPRALAGRTSPALQQIVTASCLECHNGPGRNKIDLSNLDVVPMDKRAKAALWVDRGIMPDGHPPLADTAVREFDVWAGLPRLATKKK